MIRRAFTLIEILVSLGIFSIVGLAMVMTLAMSTEIFRLGEASRTAGDEAMAALAALQDDLDHMLPPHIANVQISGAGVSVVEQRPLADAGWFFAKVLDSAAGGADPLTRGDCLVAWVVRQPDRAVAKHRWNGDGVVANDRAIVAWWLAHDGVLRRHEIPIVTVDGVAERAQLYAIANNWNETGLGTRFAAGVLHFSAWVNVMENTGETPFVPVNGANRIDWEARKTPAGNGRAQTYCGPWNNRDLDSASDRFFPDQIRFAIILSGSGRADPAEGYGVRGEVDAFEPGSAGTPAQVRVRGVRGLPASGLVRIDHPQDGTAQWVRYSGLRNGIMDIASDGFEALRTYRRDPDTGDRVLAGRLYSLVRPLPR